MDCELKASDGIQILTQPSATHPTRREQGKVEEDEEGSGDD